MADLDKLGVDEAPKPSVFRRPELLTHPNIPMPLHGVAPRVVLGKKWWDETRQKAYAVNDYHCWACGVHKTNARVRQWLEAHEAYSIDWSIGRVDVHEIVGLCHFCHNFIHSQRLYSILQKGEITAPQYESIMSHGFKILEDARLVPYWKTIWFWTRHRYGLTAEDAMKLVGHLEPEHELLAAAEVPWEDWRMVIEGQAYGPKFESYDAWKEHYQPEE